MEEENLIDINLIKKYNLEEEEFDCPVCEKNFNALLLNQHYKDCYYNYVKKIQDEANVKNKEIEKENNNNYYESLFKYLFDQMNEIPFQETFINRKLEYSDINVEDCLLIMSDGIQDIELEKDYKNVYMFNKMIKNRGLEKTYVINCNTMMDYIEYDETIIFMNTENSYSNQIKKKMNNIDNNELLYFANVNIIYFISKLLNIEHNSKLIFILYLIKVLQLSDEKLTIVDNNNFSISELVFIQHLKRLSYIDYIQMKV